MRKAKTAVKLTKTEKAYEALMHAVLQGEIQEGTFLSEAEITRRFNIGRTPYREACNRLHHEGVLEVVPRRGYLVPELSFHDVRELFELRLILEANAAELAAVRATDAEIAEMAQFSEKCESSARGARDARELIDLNSDFHLRLAKMARNRELVRLIGHLLERTARLMYIELRWFPAKASAEAFRLHAPVIAALKRRDPAGVRQALLDDIVEAQTVTLSVGHGHWQPDASVHTVYDRVTVIPAAAAPKRRNPAANASVAGPPPRHE